MCAYLHGGPVRSGDTHRQRPTPPSLKVWGSAEKLFIASSATTISSEQTCVCTNVSDLHLLLFVHITATHDSSLQLEDTYGRRDDNATGVSRSQFRHTILYHISLGTSRRSLSFLHLPRTSEGPFARTPPRGRHFGGATSDILCPVC